MEGAGGALLLSFVPWSPAYGAQVVDVRAWPAEEYTRITIEHDAPMKFKYFVLRNSDPVRLAVDIDGLLLTDKLKQIIQKVSLTIPIFPEFESARTDRMWFVSRLISRPMSILRFSR